MSKHRLSDWSGLTLSGVCKSADTAPSAGPCDCCFDQRHVCLFVTLRTAARQAPLSMGLFRQEYWSGLPFPSPGDLPNPGFKLLSLVSLILHADSLPLSHQGSPSFQNHKAKHSSGNSAAARMGGEFGGEWIHVYIWITPFAVHLNLSQHYKSATLQYKKY